MTSPFQNALQSYQEQIKKGGGPSVFCNPFDFIPTKEICLQAVEAVK